MLARAGGAETIVLVGGFSSSRYVMRSLRSALEVQGKPVVAPSYRRSAVLEGECGEAGNNYAVTRSQRYNQPRQWQVHQASNLRRV